MRHIFSLHVSRTSVTNKVIGLNYISIMVTKCDLDNVDLYLPFLHKGVDTFGDVVNSFVIQSVSNLWKVGTLHNEND